jgi:hypothetical protein
LQNAKDLWQNQVVNFYQNSTLHTEPDEQVEWLQTQWTIHFFIMNDSSIEGKKHNSSVFSLLRMLLRDYKPPENRKWNLYEVARVAKSNLGRFTRLDSHADLQIDWDKKVIRCNEDVNQLTDWNGDPVMGIIDNADIPCMDYENDEGRTIILNIMGCMVKVERTNSEIVVRYKRYKDVTKYIMPSSNVTWNSRDSINLPETPNEVTQSISKYVDTSKHELEKFTSSMESGLVIIHIPKKIIKDQSPKQAHHSGVSSLFHLPSLEFGF